MCAAWRCGGLVFRLRCRMVFPPAAFFCPSGAYSCRGAFSSVLPPFSPAVLRFVAAGRCCRGLCRFGFFAVRYFCRNRGRILRRHTAAVAKDCFSGLSKRPSFGSQKVVFCSPKGYLLHAERHLLESGFSLPRASPHGCRRGRAEPCLGRGTRRA